MNYLAHAYLSFNDPEITVGNLISDFVKGRKKFDYPKRIQEGITLHRAIDEFTDSHPATKKAMAVFRPFYRLYSGAIVDVVFDHYLANDHAEFSEASLLEFSLNTYSITDQHSKWFPPSFSRLFYFMKTHNWLYNYRTRWGIKRGLDGVVHRALYLSESRTAFRLFEENYQLLEDCYRQFWQDVRIFAASVFDSFKNTNEQQD